MNLPTFIIAGTAKAATTSLYAYLAEHPDIYMSEVKETRYFAYEPSNPDHQQAGPNRFPIRTFEEYVALFEDVDGQSAIGEASPQYIFSQHARLRMREVLPDVKLIFSLRNPAERLYSLHQMNLRNGQDKRSFSDMIRQERERLVQFGYAQSLRPWFEDFGADQIHVLLFRDLHREPGDELQKIFRFLNVDPAFSPDLETKHNVGGVPRNSAVHGMLKSIRRSNLTKSLVATMPSSLRGRLSRQAQELEAANLKRSDGMIEADELFLHELFSEDTDALEELLGRDLSVWRKAKGVA